MPATLPNAKCGNRAVPPDTGYIAPSSAWHERQDDDDDPGDDPGQQGGAARRLRGDSAPNSQPEPMIEVSDAQVAPIRPISRFRPTSVGGDRGSS